MLRLSARSPLWHMKAFKIKSNVFAASYSRPYRDHTQVTYITILQDYASEGDHEIGGISQPRIFSVIFQGIMFPNLTFHSSRKESRAQQLPLAQHAPVEPEGFQEVQLHHHGGAAGGPRGRSG